MPNAAQASTALSWYCWGSLSTIECGVDDAVEPRRWTGLEDADVVQCGGTHCLAVRSGQVHAWGANSHGQCGAERDNRIHPPTTVQFAVPVETVACGWWHSLVLTRDGRVASWGHPEQIGRDGDPFQCQLIPDICQVRQISCGFRHSIAVANDGSVYAWGQNKLYVVQPIIQRPPKDQWVSLQWPTRNCSKQDHGGEACTFSVHRCPFRQLWTTPLSGTDRFICPLLVVMWDADRC